MMDGAEVLDDAVVAVRQNPHTGLATIDLSLHGGPRVVQRALLRLKAAGIEIVEATALLDGSLPATSTAAIERELLAALLNAKTRAVAAWLMRMGRELPAVTRSVIANLQRADFEPAARTLQSLCDRERQARFLLGGIRVVIAGPPNVGKSTLANALAEQEAALVSDVPGTTRDYVEHAAAADGAPLTLVDTAGVRSTTDILESEAIRRTDEQVRTADLILWVFDAASEIAEPTRAEFDGVRGLAVLNKCDQGLSRSASELLALRPDAAVKVSARTGDNLSELRARIVSAAGLTGWQASLCAPFTPRQTGICRRALSELKRPAPDAAGAIRELVRMVESG
jgi:tRNA modification GTPase